MAAWHIRQHNGFAFVLLLLFVVLLYYYATQLREGVGSKVQGRLHPEDVSMRNEPRYALEMRIVDIGADFKGFFLGLTPREFPDFYDYYKENKTIMSIPFLPD